MKRKSYWNFVKDTITQWLEDDPFQLASSLSYYTLFSLTPLLLIVIAITGFVFSREAAQGQIVETIQGLVGPDSARAIQGMIQNASDKPRTGMISTLIGTVALLIGAGGVVGQLQTSLNKIWGVTPKPGQGIWGFVRQRFISFAMVLGIGFLLLVSLVMSALVTGFTHLMGELIGGSAGAAHDSPDAARKRQYRAKSAQRFHWRAHSPNAPSHPPRVRPLSRAAPGPPPLDHGPGALANTLGPPYARLPSTRSMRYAVGHERRPAEIRTAVRSGSHAPRS